MKRERKVWIFTVTFLIILLGYVSYRSGIISFHFGAINKVNSNEQLEERGLLTEHEAKQLVETSLDGILSSFRDLGMTYEWNTENNPPDFNILKEPLLKYGTERFVNTKLKKISEDIYCECDEKFFPSPNLDVRFKLIQNNPNEFVAETVELADLASGVGGSLTFSMKKEAGKWFLDGWSDYDTKPLNLSWEEAKKYLKTQQIQAQYIKTSTYNGQELFIYKDLKDNSISMLYKDDGTYLFGFPEEIIPDNSKGNISALPDGNLLRILSKHNPKDFYLNESKDFLRLNFGEPISESENDGYGWTFMNYKDAKYQFDANLNQIIHVEMNGERIASYSFDDVIDKLGEPNIMNQIGNSYVISYQKDNYQIDFTSRTKEGESLNLIEYYKK